MVNTNITQGQLDNVVTAINNRAKTSVVETRTSAMTKAQFFALAEEKKANRAGSGFESMGKGSSTTTANVNEGIWTDATQSNKFYIGKTTSNSGTSITNHAESMVNGILQKFKNVNNASLSIAEILLPTAPNIYPHDTVLTPEQIASGVIKHADASNSGLIVNGKFDVDTSGWSANASVNSVESGKLNITTTDFAGGAFQIIPTIVGKKYIVECVAKNVTSTDVRIRITPSYDFTTIVDSNINTTTVASALKVEFTANGASMRVYIRVNGASKQAEVDNIAVYPADAISRSDLVFLESWHEDVSEKNFVYPLGNVQYLGSNIDGLTGIVNGAFTGFETYSLFGFVN